MRNYFCYFINLLYEIYVIVYLCIIYIYVYVYTCATGKRFRASKLKREVETHTEIVEENDRRPCVFLIYTRLVFVRTL